MTKKSKFLGKKCLFSDNNLDVSLYKINCLDFMDNLITKNPEGIFDMIFADPPYFLSNGGMTCHSGKMTQVNKGDWDKSQGVEINHQFNLDWLSRCQKLLKQDATIWVSGTHHIIHSIGYAMQQLGMKVLNNITWEKPNPPPNLSCRYFTHSTETIIWAAKNSKSKHIFQYQKMRQENGDKQMKTVWNIKPTSKKEKIFGKHPTQKPLELLNRIIAASTNPKDCIFDPFSGSSTTGVAAILNKRSFVGCELETDFLNISKQRLKEAANKLQQEECEKMKKGGVGRGNTTTGLNFEKKADFLTLLKKISSYKIIKNANQVGYDIYHLDKHVAKVFKKHEFYKFLAQENIDWKKIISSKLLPDDALLVIIRETLFIIEVKYKYQETAGSVDKKLQTCDFKRKQYLKLISSMGLKVEYVYVLNDWFKQPKYNDVLDYIHSVNCHYKFNELPLAWLGLPT